MLGLPGFGQAIEAAAELYDLAAITQGIEDVGVHAERDQVASAECAALAAEGPECCVEGSGFHVGNNSAIYK